MRLPASERFVRYDYSGISLPRFIVRNSSFWLNFTWFTCLLTWVILEVSVSDRVEGVFKHIIELVKTMCNTYVTGYIFYWGVSLIPELRLKYTRQALIEECVHDLFDWYRFWAFTLFKEIGMPNTLKGSLFHHSDPNCSIIFRTLYRYSTNNKVDPNERFKFFRQFVIPRIGNNISQLEDLMNRMNDDELHLITKDLRTRHSELIRGMKDKSEKPFSTMRSFLYNQHDLQWSLVDIYEWLESLIFNHRYISDSMLDMYNSLNYDWIRQTIEIEKSKRENALQKLSLLIPPV